MTARSVAGGLQDWYSFSGAVLKSACSSYHSFVVPSRSFTRYASVQSLVVLTSRQNRTCQSTVSMSGNLYLRR
ncbi:hypothetical protein DIPPA_23401 [Diplonema papillatum]|nr:hypothetical protein DIPPA_23401 [Diplonema papillatum]